MPKILFIASVLALLLLRVGGLEAQWVQTNGPYGCGVQCLAVCGMDIYAATMYADPTHAGVYRSTDDGLNWVLANSGLPVYIAVVALATDDSNIYAAVQGRGVYRTLDHGASWNEMNSGLMDTHVRALSEFGSDLYVSTDSGVFRSTDGAQHWIKANSGMPSSNLVYCFAKSGKSILAGTMSGPYISSDNGSSWTSINHGLPTQFPEAYTLIDFGSTLYAGMPDGIFRSSDGGLNWKADSILATTIGFPFSFAVDSGELFVSTLKGGVLRRMPQGWVPVSNSIADRSIMALAVEGPYLFAATKYAGVVRWKYSVGDWVTARAGLPVNPPDVSALYTQGDRLLVGSEGPLAVTSTAGDTWDYLPVAGASGFDTLGPYLFVKTFFDGVYRSSDGGSTWDGPDLDSFQGSRIVATGRNVYALTNNGPYVSIDSGANWIKFRIGTDSVITSIDYSGGEAFAQSWQTVYRSKDGGQSWQVFARPRAQGEDSLAEGFALVFNSSFLIASGTNDYVHTHLLRSSDDGATWIDVDSTLPSIRQMQVTAGALFARVDTGIILSTSNGSSWISVNPGIPNDYFTSIALQGTDLFAGTTASGVWRRPLSEVIPKGVVEAPVSLLNVILGAYPNPISSSTTINVATRTHGPAQITIHNLLGTEVARLFSGELGAGEHSFTWDARGVAPGMYECVVRMNGSVERVPMMVVR